jgi:hypothetical protein
MNSEGADCLGRKCYGGLRDVASTGAGVNRACSGRLFTGVRQAKVAGMLRPESQPSAVPHTQGVAGRCLCRVYLRSPVFRGGATNEAAIAAMHESAGKGGHWRTEVVYRRSSSIRLLKCNDLPASAATPPVGHTRVLPTHCTRGCGCGGHPAFPAPSVFLGERFLHNSGETRREGANACHESVIARSEATKQSILPLPGKMDCFASLAMTVCNRTVSGCLRLNQG